MVESFNPYKILGVSSLDKKEAIKKKYRELVKYYHPDNKTGDSEKFESIQKAWDYIEENHKDVQRNVWVHSGIFTIAKY